MGLNMILLVTITMSIASLQMHQIAEIKLRGLCGDKMLKHTKNGWDICKLVTSGYKHHTVRTIIDYGGMTLLNW